MEGGRRGSLHAAHPPGQCRRNLLFHPVHVPAVRVHRGLWDLRDLREFLVLLVHRVRKVLQVLKDCRDFRDPQAHLVRLDLRG